MRRHIAWTVLLVLPFTAFCRAENKAPATVAKPASTYHSRTAKALSTKAAQRNHKKKDREQMLREAKAMDEKVAAYLKANEVESKIAAALWAAQPVVGMTEEQLSLFCHIRVESESEGIKTATVIARPDSLPTRAGDREHMHGVTLVEGVIRTITH